MLRTLSLQPLPAAAQALRAQVRAFLDEALQGMPAELRARSWLGCSPQFSRALAARGWIGAALPAEYGGGGRDAFARFVLVEELLAQGAPVSAHWIAERQSAPMILRYGTEAQKRAYVPAVCRGEAFFCIGMSEPQAGSDLAAVRTRAQRRADGGWRLNGHKIWTTNADHAHYMMALVRTSGGPEDRHRGLSQLVIDMKTPGIRVRPIEDLTGDRHFCEVFFDDVELPPDALVGEEGAGWEQVTAELAYERSGPERIYSSVVLLDSWLQHLRAGGADAAACALAGRLVAQLATLRSMSLAVTGLVASGQSPMTEAALVKDLGTELEQRMPIAIADALADDGSGAAPSASLLRTLAYLTQFAPTFSLRGGTREILRGLIARGLGVR